MGRGRGWDIVEGRDIEVMSPQKFPTSCKFVLPFIGF